MYLKHKNLARKLHPEKLVHQNLKRRVQLQKKGWVLDTTKANNLSAGQMLVKAIMGLKAKRMSAPNTMNPEKAIDLKGYLKPDDKYTKVYQYRVTLCGTSVWRKLQIPENYTFWDLHVAIQDSFGWLDCHGHKFNVLKNPKDPSSKELVDVGIPVDFMPDETIPGWTVRVKDYISIAAPRCMYEYDFGDSWEHLVGLESIMKREKKSAISEMFGWE